MKIPKTTNDVEPVPFEAGRYWVRSASRRGMKHLVDLDYDEIQTKPRKGKPCCSCEDCQCRDVECKHIRKVKAYLANLTAQERAEQGLQPTERPVLIRPQRQVRAMPQEAR